MQTIQTPVSVFQNIQDYFKSDARHFQIIFLLLFIFFGVSALNWDFEFLIISIFISSCLIFQAIANSITKNNAGLKSAFISALSLSLMFKTSEPSIAVLAAALSILPKFIVKINGKHFFNPTNFGIITTLLLTDAAWISPGRWGSDFTYLLILGVAGISVVSKVNRLDTAFAFLITFCTLLFARNVLYLGWTGDVFVHQISSGSLLLFAFFMITDPITTPKNKYARMVWAALVGVLAFILTTKFQVYTAPIWALFILSFFTPLANKFFKGESFTWKSKSK